MECLPLGGNYRNRGYLVLTLDKNNEALETLSQSIEFEYISDRSTLTSESTHH